MKPMAEADIAGHLEAYAAFVRNGHDHAGIRYQMRYDTVGTWMDVYYPERTIDWNDRGFCIRLKPGDA